MDFVRETALKILAEIEKNGAFSNIAIKQEFAKEKRLSDKDRYFITNIVYGVVDKKMTLDYIIKQFSKIKLNKISTYILLILRMGIYQIKFMDKVPDNASVNESVKLAKRYGHGASAGFVNGILRSVTRNEIKYPDDLIENLSVRYSYPQWLVEKWIKDFGEEFSIKLMESFTQSRKLNLRANVLKTSNDEVLKLLSEYNATLKNEVIECDGFNIAQNELYKKGYFSVQDSAAQQVAKLLAPKKGETVIDMCAAPGGKTAHIAELMENDGEIFAWDIYEHKVELIKKNANRLGIDIIKAKVCDATKENTEMYGKADKVLCDVPCSGLGIIGRKPEIKWNREDDFKKLYEVQMQILNNASKYVKKGGAIVYSTCTISKEENEDITSKFLKNNPKFKKEYEKTFYPHIDFTDGFYMCKLIRSKDA